MRTIFFLLLLCSPALAAEWTTYSNPRFGVSIDVPPGFENDVPEPDNGDGLTFHSVDGRAELLVWGSNLVDADISKDAVERLKSETEDGWNISYMAGVDGSGWHVYSGTRQGLLLYAKSIVSCQNTQALHFRIEYPAAQKDDYDPIVERLGKSLKAGPAFDCP